MPVLERAKPHIRKVANGSWICALKTGRTLGVFGVTPQHAYQAWEHCMALQFPDDEFYRLHEIDIFEPFPHGAW